MKRYTDLEYLKLSKINRFFYRFLSFIIAIPLKLLNFIKLIGKYIAKFSKKVVNEILDIIIDKLGGMSKNEIVDFMHKEEAYIKTMPKDIIAYEYTESLQI